jgi:predicted small lipoprotein YifL
MARALVVALVLGSLLAAPLAGCGKKGDPEPPDPNTATWPRQYPTR